MFSSAGYLFALGGDTLYYYFFSSFSSFAHEVRMPPANAWISFWTKEKGEELIVFALGEDRIFSYGSS